MTRRPKTPLAPSRPLVAHPTDTIHYTGILWRVHRTVGEHALPWNALRDYGPLASMRWDPHPEPPTPAAEGVLYTSGDVATALAEVFQVTRLIDTRTAAPRLTAWQPVRALRLLDLSDTWLIRNGASAALPAGPRSTCRRWARAIRVTWPDLDGLAVPSTMTGRPNVVLWRPAANSLPESPSFSRALADPLVWSIAQDAATEVGYRIR